MSGLLLPPALKSRSEVKVDQGSVRREGSHGYQRDDSGSTGLLLGQQNRVGGTAIEVLSPDNKTPVSPTTDVLKE